MSLTRRAFVGATLGGLTVFGRSLRAAEHTLIQYHNQTVSSSLHRRIVELWEAVRMESRGRIEAQVFPLNNGIQGSDPAALDRKSTRLNSSHT